MIYGEGTENISFQYPCFVRCVHCSCLQKPENLFCTGAHIIFCGFCIHGFFQSGDSPYYGKESINTRLVAG